MVRDVVSLRRWNPFRGGVEGVGPESQDFFWALWNRPSRRRWRFGALKKVRYTRLRYIKFTFIFFKNISDSIFKVYLSFLFPFLWKKWPIFVDFGTACKLLKTFVMSWPGFRRRWRQRCDWLLLMFYNSIELKGSLLLLFIGIFV